MTRRVVVVDYGVGNLFSVLKALAHEGAEVVVSSEPEAIARAPRVVLPGVGAFPDGMKGLASRDLVEPLRDFLRSGKPLLGICLGMQLLLEEGTEFGAHAGLGFVAGRVVRLPVAPPAKVPHVGWNALVEPPGRPWTGTALDGCRSGEDMMYFVHSFVAAPARDADRLADVFYGGERLCAAIARDNVTGMQFHPEKSGAAGLRLLRRFVEQ